MWLVIVDKFTKKGYTHIRKYGMEVLCSARWDGNALQLERFCERLVLTAYKRNMDEVCIRELLLELYPKIEIHSGIQSVVVYEPPEKKRSSRRFCSVAEIGRKRPSCSVSVQQHYGEK